MKTKIILANKLILQHCCKYSAINLFKMKFNSISKKFFSGFDADLLGMISSVVCLIHCLFLPLLLILQPILFSFVKDLEENKWWEWLDFLFLAIGLLAVILSTKKMIRKQKTIFYIAYLVFAFGILLGGNWIILSYLGSIWLAILHFKNYQTHKNCKI